jgi:hypothetical protein
VPTPASAKTHASDQFIHAGGGAGLALIQLAAIIPGLLPCIALGAVFAALLIVPLAALALAVMVLLVVSWSAWRLSAMVVRRLRARTLAGGVGSSVPEPSARSRPGMSGSSGRAATRRGAMA